MRVKYRGSNGTRYIIQTLSGSVAGVLFRSELFERIGVFLLSA